MLPWTCGTDKGCKETDVNTRLLLKQKKSPKSFPESCRETAGCYARAPLWGREGGLGGAPPCWHHPNGVVGMGLPLTPCLDFLLEGNLWWKDLHMST